jgi:hypothetical protein
MSDAASIAARAVASLITTQGVGDLYRIDAIAQRDRVDFNLAYIPASLRRTAPAGVRYRLAARAVQGGGRPGDQGQALGEAAARHVRTAARPDFVTLICSASSRLRR